MIGLNNKTAEETPAKLCIELVPKTCWFSNVRNHIKKGEWDTVRKIVFQKAQNKCEICGGRGKKWPVECHERFMYDDTRHSQTLIGLIALCPECHQTKHFGLARVRGIDKQAMWHLCAVNGWEIDQGVDHVNRQFEIWVERSQHEWSVDLGFMKREFGIEISEESASKRAEYGEAL